MANDNQGTIKTERIMFDIEKRIKELTSEFSEKCLTKSKHEHHTLSYGFYKGEINYNELRLYGHGSSICKNWTKDIIKLDHKIDYDCFKVSVIVFDGICYCFHGYKNMHDLYPNFFDNVKSLLIFENGYELESTVNYHLREYQNLQSEMDECFGIRPFYKNIGTFKERYGYEVILHQEKWGVQTQIKFGERSRWIF